MTPNKKKSLRWILIPIFIEIIIVILIALILYFNGVQNSAFWHIVKLLLQFISGPLFFFLIFPICLIVGLIHLFKKPTTPTKPQP